MRGGLLLVGLAVSLFGCSPQPKEKVEAAKNRFELKQQLEAVLKSENVPGASVAVVRGDVVEMAEGLGLADVEAKISATAQTRFRIGSTSKAFVSLSLLKLANEGKIILTDSVRRLVPEVWFENAWEETDPVLVVDLLEHTTGWDDMHFKEYAKDDPKMSLRDAFSVDHHSRTSRWRPGTRMAYCNSGSAVAAYIVEKITGERFEDYVQKNFFDPIGMKDATYFEPKTNFTKLYRLDAETPFPYWNLIYRPAGSINASANDMAAYLRFYLNRGRVGDSYVLPQTAIDRAEVPVRTWAAQEGLKFGYGLGNYSTIHDGFVYHGHGGAVLGGRSEMAYLPQFGVGYYFSINASNPTAFGKMGDRIRAFITRELQKPAVMPEVALPNNFDDFSGWYQFDSPRIAALHFLDRLLGLIHVKSGDGKMVLSSWTGEELSYAHVGNGQFRAIEKDEAPQPVATAILIRPNEEGRFVQIGEGGQTFRQIGTWSAWIQLILLFWFVLSLNLILLYSPLWIVGGLIKKWRKPKERALRAWPLVAVSSIILLVLVLRLSGEDLFASFGEITFVSFGVFALSMVFAFACLASFITLFRARGVRRFVRWYATFVTIGLCIGALYLAYWGAIGYMPWT